MIDITDSAGSLVRALDNDIAGGFFCTSQREHRTLVFYGTVCGEVCSDGYRLFMHTDAPPAGELCPVVAARMLLGMLECRGDWAHSPADIALVGEHLGFDENRGPFARAARFCLDVEDRLDALVEERLASYLPALGY